MRVTSSLIEALALKIARAARPLNRYSDFRGRACRSEFWRFTALAIGAISCGGAMDMLIFGSADLGPLPFYTIILALALAPPLLAAGARRLHDAGKSGWLMLGLLVPVIGWLLLLHLWARPSAISGRARGGWRR